MYSIFETKVTVRPDDIDMNNHVHYSRYLDYILMGRYDQMKKDYKVSMEEFVERGFSWAVQNDLLTDYKVIVLAVDEGLVSRGVQKRLSDENSELLLDDATKIIGCYKALTKADMKEDVAADP